jgi:hypothetical protein
MDQKIVQEFVAGENGQHRKYICDEALVSALVFVTEERITRIFGSSIVTGYWMKGMDAETEIHNQLIISGKRVFHDWLKRDSNTNGYRTALRYAEFVLQRIKGDAASLGSMVPTEPDGCCPTCGRKP